MIFILVSERFEKKKVERIKINAARKRAHEKYLLKKAAKLDNPQKDTDDIR
jgi:hypothetical protein